MTTLTLERGLLTSMDDTSPSDDRWQWVLDAIPQKRPFRFVDRLIDIDDTGAIGAYTFRPTESFYAGHFPGNPITPGVIITESIAQIALVSLGIFLSRRDTPTRTTTPLFLFTESEMEFLRPVRPGETLVARSELIYWRHGKLAARVRGDVNGETVAQGRLSGMRVTR